MMAPHAFVFIKTDDQVALGRAILRINAARRQRLAYASLLLTAPRRKWIALLLGRSGTVDHLLMRNLSGQLSTIAFELQLDEMGFLYRLHRVGRTVSAFESNLQFHANHRLQMLESSRDVNTLDLAEPIDRFVLRRFQERQHPRAPITTREIPRDVWSYYLGDPAKLRVVLRADVDEQYIASLLAPGFNPEAAFEQLVSVLDLPYLPSDDVLVSTGQGRERRVDGYALTRPETWQDALPAGWRRMPSIPLPRS